MTTSQKHSQNTRSVDRAASVGLIDAARTASADIEINVAIAVTNFGGHLTALQTMDHTPFLAIKVAIDKAWTAVSYHVATHIWSDVIKNPEVQHLAHIPGLSAVAGGYPIIEDGIVIGGIGVSGGTWEQDKRIAEAALTALGFEFTT